jgi:hypothetical protein
MFLAIAAKESFAISVLIREALGNRADQSGSGLPASQAAPSAVVSSTVGRSTGAHRACRRAAAWSSRMPPCRHRRASTVSPPAPFPVLAHRVQQIALSGSRQPQALPGQIPQGRCCGSAKHRAARVRIPMRRTEPGEGGHQIDVLRGIGPSRQRGPLCSAFLITLSRRAAIAPQPRQ